MTTIADILDAAMCRHGLQPSLEPSQPLDIQARVLRELLPELQRPNPFQVGDLVEQSEHLSAYTWPRRGQLAVVVELLERGTQRTDRDDRYERCDMVIAVSANGPFVTFAVESFRFRPYTGEVA